MQYSLFVKTCQDCGGRMRISKLEYMDKYVCRNCNDVVIDKGDRK